MFWLCRVLLLISVLITGTTAWLYGSTGEVIMLGLAIFVIVTTTASAVLFAEARYNEGRVDGMNWLKNLWRR